MSTKVVLGGQWGDEGKAKIVDILASCADVVVRTSGGNNAGHTVINNGETYKFHLIPSGILYEKTLCIIGNGCVIDIDGFLDELNALKQKGISDKNLYISERAHLVLPYHKVLDGASEEALGEQNIGTTKKGIGPAYMDKAERSGIRVIDLFFEETLKKQVFKNVEIKNKILKHVYGLDTQIDPQEMYDKLISFREEVKDLVADTTVMVHESIVAGKDVLFEGAQGSLLDIDTGTYPYVTSSHPVAGGVSVGAGIGPNQLDRIIGVLKGYITRVGEGPFPTELTDELGEKIRQAGHEFGTTTGRPRRCGWFDAVAGEFAVRTSGLTEIVLNKIDVLSGLGKIKICTAYEYEGKTLKHFPSSLKILEKCKPIYEEIEGFGDISHIKTYDELPEEAKNYIRRIEKLLSVKVSMIGVGPDRTQNIVVD